MSDFPWSAYSKWQNPPDLHEICSCDGCHDAEEHTDDIEYWSKIKGCAVCVETLDSAVRKDEYCLLHHVWYCEKIHEGENFTVGPSEN